MKSSSLQNPLYRSLCGVILATLLTSTSSIRAAEITLGVLDDAFLTTSSPSAAAAYQNVSTSVLLGGSRYGGYQNPGEVSLLRFDLSTFSLPTDAVITGVTLNLTAAYGYPYSFNEVLRFFQVSSDNAAWIDGAPNGDRQGVTGAYLNQTSYTSTSVHSGDRWASGGVFARSPGDLGDEVGSRAFTSITAGTTYAFDLDIDLIERWMNDSTSAAAGLAFYLTNDETTPAGSRFIYFHSSKATVGAALLPSLTIQYEVIPEPASIVSLLLGGLAIAGFYRRRA